MYALVAALYFYGLLFRDVGSGVHVLRDNIDKNMTYASAPVWGAPMGEEVQLTPRSLADVTIANAEVAWKRQLDHQKDVRRRAEKVEAQRKMREEAVQLRIRQYNSTASDAEAHSDDGESHQPKVLRLSNSSVASNVSHSDAMQYLKGATNLKRSHQRRRVDNIKGDLGFLPVLIMITMCTIFRVMVSILIGQTANLDSLAESDRGYGDAGRGSIPSFMAGFNGGRDAARLRRRARAARAHRQFQRFVDRLNAEREANGERQISADTLRHLVNERDFTGNDYDRLHEFAEESGNVPIFSAIGATEAEINRCPSRALAANDDLLRPRQGSGGRGRQSCPVCLESYQLGETVRTIPCFHTFHKGCIDPWLAQRAECPVCKHSAIG